MTITAELADGRKLEFPDGTDPGVIQRTVKGLIGQGQPQTASQMQKVQASAPMRFAQGMRDPIDAGAQIASRVSPDWLTNALDYFPAKMRNSNSPLLQTIGESFFADPRAKAVDQRLAETEQQYQQARNLIGANDPGFDGMRLLGNIASPVNAGIAKVIPAPALNTATKMAVTGGTLGGIGGALTPVLEKKEQEDFGASKASQIGLGAATGAVLTPVLGKVMEAAAPYIQKAITKIAGTSEGAAANASLETDVILKKALDEIGQRFEDVPKAQMDALRRQVNDALKQGTKLDAATLLRKGDFEGLGIPFTQGQITRDPTQFARERNLRGVAGIGDPLMQTFELQNKGLQSKVGALATGAVERTTAGEQISGALKITDDQLRGKVGALYQAARESSGKDLEVPLTGLAQDAAKVIEDFEDKVPTAVRNKLGQYGILKVGDQTKLFTFDEANKLLQTINDHVGSDATINKALSKLRDAVKNAMLDSGSDDVFSAARKAAAERFKLQDAIPALKAAANGEVAADDFVRRFVVNGKADEVKGLAKILKVTSPEAYAQARAQLGAELQRAAFGENVAGDKIFSPERFATKLREIGTEKLSAFFTDLEIAGIQRAARAGAYINSIPGAAAVNTSNTASTAMNLFGMIPGVRPALSVAKAVAVPILNQRAVSGALSTEVPQSLAPASPELIRRLQLGSGLVGFGGALSSVPR